MFKKKPPQAKKDPENPFVANREETDDRYQNLVIAAHNWRVAWQLTFAVFVVSFCFNGYYMMLPKFVPYTVETDKIGNVIAIGPATKGSPVDTKRLIRRQVMDFIENARTVVGDNLAEKKMINWVYARVPSQSQTKNFLDTFYAKERNPFLTAQTSTVSVEVTNVLNMGSDKSWQVEWVETIRNLAGEIIGQQRYKAYLAYELSPLDTEDGINSNPLGFFVLSLNWSKQL